jgi:murein DD-endopeptidase MepM/ murein hydrolase activator NlpD
MKAVVPNRRWTFIIVPPEPGAPTRQVSIGARAFKVVSTVTLTALSVLGLWAAADAQSLVAMADRLANAQRMILSMHDTVHVLRARVLADAAATDSAPEMIMPVDGQVTSIFSRSRLHPLLHFFRPHEGIDLSAPAGSRIVAPALATVSFVGWRLGDGLTVELSHNGGVTTLYAHCRSVLVRVGQRVRTGTPIATVGESGIATGPHVHFEVRVRGKLIDPLQYLAGSRRGTGLVAGASH